MQRVISLGSRRYRIDGKKMKRAAGAALTLVVLMVELAYYAGWCMCWWG